MPSLRINDNPTSFSFFDSGRPQQEIYTTVVILHGYGFHGNSYRRMFTLAPLKGLRLICVDRRDYGQTTLYTPTELKALAEASEAEMASFLESRGVEMAVFLDRLIDELSLPPPIDGDTDGGLALMGWSAGNVTSIATIAAAAHIPASTHLRLQVYLRRFILWSPASALALGLPDPPNGWLPLYDLTMTEVERGAAFAEWVSGYYTHGDVSTHDPAVLNIRNPDAGRTSTISRMSPKDYDSIFDFVPVKRSDEFTTSKPAVLTRQAHKALFDPAGQQVWPNVRNWILCGEKEPWSVRYASWWVDERAKSSGRDVRAYEVPDANHFMFWDAPERTIEALAYIVHN